MLSSMQKRNATPCRSLSVSPIHDHRLKPRTSSIHDQIRRRFASIESSMWLRIRPLCTSGPSDHGTTMEVTKGSSHYPVTIESTCNGQILRITDDLRALDPSSIVLLAVDESSSLPESMNVTEFRAYSLNPYFILVLESYSRNAFRVLFPNDDAKSAWGSKCPRFLRIQKPD